MKILHLPLKAKWYDMIERGEKPEDYREIKPYWEKRLIDYKALKANYQAIALKRYMLGIWTDVCKAFPRGYTHVLLRRGYTKRTMLFGLDEIIMGKGNPDWGAPEEQVFIIKLGGRCNP